MRCASPNVLPSSECVPFIHQSPAALVDPMKAVDEWRACITICTSAVGRPSYCMDLSRGPISPPAGNRSQDIYPISLYRLLMRSLTVSNQSYRFRRLEIIAIGD